MTVRRSATEQLAQLEARTISAREVLAEHLEQVNAWNPVVNAIVTLDTDGAMADAQSIDDRRVAGEPVGLLAGLPVAHKDLEPVAGMRSTSGSPILSDFIPTESSIIVDRMKAADAVTLGKTNTPEFGAGSQTFNSVFGVTRNPYDSGRTCGGSSGGAAVALATGMVSLADGSDMGGSLRNPASFCNVVGMRPSAGLVPTGPTDSPWSTLSVKGPMARSVSDVALLMQAIAGSSNDSPISLPGDPRTFARSLDCNLTGVRIAWSSDLGLPVDPEVVATLAFARDVFANLGCEVVDASPDLRDAAEIFQVLRAWAFEMRCGPLYETKREQMKDTVRWNIEEARRRSLSDHVNASRKHARLFRHMQSFMTRYEALVLPVSQVVPFPVETEWVTEIDGQSMETYIDWMRSCSDISVTGLPAISVPAGFTAGGLPVGLQIVGRHREDFRTMQIAHMFEQVTETGQREPVL